MNAILHTFWNPTDRRLRAFWRLLLHASLIIFMTVLAVAVFTAPLEQLFAGLSQQVGLTAGRLTETIFGGLAVVVATLLAARFLDRRRLADLGLRLSPGWWRDLGFGLALGAGLMLLIFLIELALGWVTVDALFFTRMQLPFGLAILLPLVQFLAVGFYEELMSRGYQLRNIAEGLNFAPLGPKGGMLLALLISSAIFGGLHAANPNASLISTLNITLAGLFLGLPLLLTDELAIPIGIHITWNFFQGNVFGFPVSGTSVNHTTFIAIAQAGPALWTGGAFGPEAGLLGIGAMLAGALLTVWWVRRTRGEARLQPSVAAYQPPQLQASAEGPAEKVRPIEKESENP